jgi:hypothetical protein
MKFQDIPENTPDDKFVFIECDITGKTKKTRYGVAKANVAKNNGKYITNWGIAKLNNPMKHHAVKEKVKQTNMERYGSTTALNTPENLEKRKHIFDDAEFVKKRNDKHKQTCVERYGVEHQMHIDEVKDKVKATNIERYGVEVPLQNEDILAKAQATNLERYGDVCSLNNPEVRAKALKSLFEHYGVEYYNQLPEMKDYLRENCREWLKDSWANPWAKGITRPEEWNEKQRETIAKLFELGEWKGGGKSSLKGTYISEKCKKKISIFRSSYELKTHWALNKDSNVEWYDYEPFQVVYEDAEGKKRHYTIDFVVKYKNRDRLLAIEVKNNYAQEAEITNRKHRAFMEECGGVLDHEFWANDKIKSLGLDTKELIASDKVKIWE